VPADREVKLSLVEQVALLRKFPTGSPAWRPSWHPRLDAFYPGSPGSQHDEALLRTYAMRRP